MFAPFTYFNNQQSPETPEEYRILRDHLLLLCDWSQLSDNALSEEKREEWSEYRQALRDLTGQLDFPNNINWPTPPSKN